MAKQVKRLYSDFQPRHYNLDLNPDNSAMKFSGSVIVSGQKTGRPSQRLTFHSSGLKITKAHVVKHDKSGDKEIGIDRINLQRSLDEVRLHSKDMLYPGSYTVSLQFEGQITRQMNGIYPCFFKHKGKDKKLIATQFESHHAREVFPCIDEPEAKATFQLSIVTPKNNVVLSNTPIEKEEAVDILEFIVGSKKGEPKTLPTGRQADNYKLTTFQTTPTMSTYLLAFVFGELGFKEAKTKKGVTVRTYATPDNVKLTDFALDVAVKCLDFYSDYFDLDYPLAKCDLIALPDFAAGAMENWGCITFREQALLVDPEHTSLANKQYVALVVAHELAHQWFGNLVTMRWWTDLWLNEGFASWIEYLAIDKLFPDWKMWTQFIVDEQQQALKLDALEHTHPIEVTVNHPDEIRTIFDAVSYSKGASIINMLHKYLGGEAFKTGLRYYLQTHAYKNTATIDLWTALQEVTHKPVKDFMHAWTTLAGFPLIRADVSVNIVKLSQERFYVNPLHSKKAEHVWPVALLADNKNIPELLDKPSSSQAVSNSNELKLNRQQSGFYRTLYNTSHLEILGQQIKTGKLSSIDRIGILADAVEAARAGYADTADVLEFLKNFSNEDDYTVWDIIASLIGSIRLVMDDEQLREDIKPFVRQLTAKQLKRLGWDRKKDDTHFDRLLRPTILGMSAAADQPEIIDKCWQLFNKIEQTDDLSPELTTVPSKRRVKRGVDIDPDLRGTVYGTIARLGGQKEFEKLVKLHNSASLSEVRVTLSAAITGFKQPELIDKALAMIKSDEVRLQDTAYWIAYSYLNRHAKRQAWVWTQQNWAWLSEHLGSDLAFYRLPVYVARSFSDIKFLDEYKDFFTSVMSPALDRSFKQGIEMIEAQAAWKQKALKETQTFFKSYSKSGKKSLTS